MKLNKSNQAAFGWLVKFLAACVVIKLWSFVGVFVAIFLVLVPGRKLLR